MPPSSGADTPKKLTNLVVAEDLSLAQRIARSLGCGLCCELALRSPTAAPQGEGREHPLSESLLEEDADMMRVPPIITVDSAAESASAAHSHAASEGMHQWPQGIELKESSPNPMLGQYHHERTGQWVSPRPGL